MNIQFSVDGVSTVPDDVGIDDVYIEVVVYYPNPDGSDTMVAVDKWETQITNIEKEETS